MLRFEPTNRWALPLTTRGARVCSQRAMRVGMPSAGLWMRT